MFNAFWGTLGDLFIGGGTPEPANGRTSDLLKQLFLGACLEWALSLAALRR